MTSADIIAAEPATDPESTADIRSFGSRFLHKPLGMAALVVLVGICLACAAAPLLTSGGPLAENLLAAKQTPSWHHLLGTDLLGRDVLTRILYGGRITLIGVAEALAVYVVVGVLVGLWAGYARNWVDRLVSGVVDIFLSLPTVVIMLVVLAMSQNSLTAAMLTLGFVSSGGLVRVVRASTLAVRGELYVDAAQVSGLGPARILVRHVFPRVFGQVVVLAAIFGGVALAVQTGLGFLNLGVTPPAPSWGGMVGEASQVIQEFPWLLIPSGATIALVVLCFGLIGDAARDANAETSARSGGTRPLTTQHVVRGATRPAPAPDALLVVEDLRISFGGAEAVAGVTFQLSHGEIVGLVGESGSGKSVTALSLLGLLPGEARVSATALRFGENDLLASTERDFERLRGTGIAMVWQEPMIALDPAFNVGSQLREVVRVHQPSLRGRALKARVHELLATVRLPDPGQVAGMYPHQLSGGMAQRVVIAMALAGDPKLLVADEPTTALDVTVQAEILELLRTLQAERDMAILFITHDLAVVADICQRALVMQYGRIVEAQPVDDLFASPQHPYTQALMRATPSLLEGAA